MAYILPITDLIFVSPKNLTRKINMLLVTFTDQSQIIIVIAELDQVVLPGDFTGWMLWHAILPVNTC